MLQRVWLARSKDMGDVAPSNEGQIFTPIKEGDLLHHAEIMTLRQIGNTLQSMTAELQASRSDMTDLKIDVAVIKERQTQSMELKEKLTVLEAKIEKLEARNTKQDGAFSFMTMLKDFGPWIMAFAAVVWGLLSHAPTSR